MCLPSTARLHPKHQFATTILAICAAPVPKHRRNRSHNLRTSLQLHARTIRRSVTESLDELTSNRKQLSYPNYPPDTKLDKHSSLPSSFRRASPMRFATRRFQRPTSTLLPTIFKARCSVDCISSQCGSARRRLLGSAQHHIVTKSAFEHLLRQLRFEHLYSALLTGLRREHLQPCALRRLPSLMRAALFHGCLRVAGRLRFPGSAFVAAGCNSRLPSSLQAALYWLPSSLRAALYGCFVEAGRTFEYGAGRLNVPLPRFPASGY